MNRIKFIGIADGTMIAAGITSYLLSDKSNLLKTDIKSVDGRNKMLKLDEQ